MGKTRCCDQDKIHCTKRCSLSFIRIRTAIKATLAIIAASIFWFVPEASIVLDPQWTVLMIILTGISLSASHSLGGSIQSAKYLLASGLLAAIPNLIFYTVTYDNQWLGIGLFFFWTAAIGLLYVAADPSLTHITCIRFTALSLLMVLIFPPRFNRDEQSYYYAPPVQNLIMMTIAYLYCVVAVLIFPTRWVIKLPNEFSITLKRCNKMFELLVKLSRLPKKSMEMPKLHELVAEGDGMSAMDKSILHEELRREIDEEKLAALSQKLIKDVRWLYSILAESKLERWVNPEIFAAEEEIIRKLDGLVGHLVTMKIALGHGFIKTTIHEIFPKLMPQFDLLQNRFFAHVDATREKLRYVFTKKEKDFSRIQELDTILIEASSPDVIAKHKHEVKTLKSLADIISDEYIEQIKEMESKGELHVIPTNEVGRMNFYLWRLIDLVDKLQQIEDAVTQFGQKLRVDKTWQYRHVIGHVLAYPFYDIFLVMRDLLNSTLKPQKAYLKGLKEIWHNEQWKYPVRLAFFVGGVSIASIYVSSILPNVRANWTTVTMIVIITPSVGATFKRGLHRIIGTIIGAAVAWLTLVIATYANAVAILLTFTFVFCFIATYLQYSSLYQKPYSMVVAVLTFLVIAYPPYPNIDYNDWGPPLYRFLNILAGVVIGIIATLPFPMFTFRRLRASYVSSVQKSAEIMRTVLVDVDHLHSNYQEISKGVKEINSTVKLQSKWLKEAKSEILFNRVQKKIFIRIMEHMANLAFLLLAVEEVCSGGFSEQMIAEVFEPLRSDFAYMADVAEIQVYLFKGFLDSNKMHPAHRVAARKIKLMLKKIQKRHEKTRKREVDLKKLHKLHPEMIKFNSFLYTIGSLMQEWRKMMDLASEIKKKKRVKLKL